MALKILSPLNVPRSWFVAIAPSHTLTTLLPANTFPNKKSPSVPNNMQRNQPLRSFALFFIVLLTPLPDKTDSSRDLVIFTISFKFWFRNNNVVVPDPNIFLWIAASIVDTAAVNPNGIKAILANGLRTFPIKGKANFSNGPRSLPKNSSDCIILYNWVFDNFIIADELSAKVLQSLKKVCIINNNLCGKKVSALELPITFNERFRVTSVSFLNRDFKLLNYEIDIFAIKVLYWYYIK